MRSQTFSLGCAVGRDPQRSWQSYRANHHPGGAQTITHARASNDDRSSQYYNIYTFLVEREISKVLSCVCHSVRCFQYVNPAEVWTAAPDDSCDVRRRVQSLPIRFLQAHPSPLHERGEHSQICNIIGPVLNMFSQTSDVEVFS